MKKERKEGKRGESGKRRVLENGMESNRIMKYVRRRVAFMFGVFTKKKINTLGSNIDSFVNIVHISNFSHGYCVD